MVTAKQDMRFFGHNATPIENFFGVAFCVTGTGTGTACAAEERRRFSPLRPVIWMSASLQIDKYSIIHKHYALRILTYDILVLQSLRSWHSKENENVTPNIYLRLAEQLWVPVALF
jgi:hypothetical protein